MFVIMRNDTTCCNTLQHTCNTPATHLRVHHIFTLEYVLDKASVPLKFVAHLQHTAKTLCNNTLQHTATTHCNNTGTFKYVLDKASIPLKFIATHLQPTATTHCNNTLQDVIKIYEKSPASSVNYQRSLYVSQTLYFLSKEPIYDLCKYIMGL